MPELPEVETVKRALASRITGLRIERVQAHRTDLRWPLPRDFANRVVGRRVVNVTRRGKYLLVRLSGEQSMLLHLGMTGRILLGPTTSPDLPHEHVTFDLEMGTRLSFVDPRRFGSVDLLLTKDEAHHPRLAILGPEPFDPSLTGALFARTLAVRHAPVKTVLLDQKTIAGLGNIYASEALFRARISPRRRGSHLGALRSGRLLRAIRETLNDAIEAGGSSFSDYVQPSGELGTFQTNWNVYDRLRCPLCPGPPRCSRGVVRITQAGRSTFYCPSFQR